MLFETEYEVRFSDVDQHGVMHHPKYVYYLEEARIKMLTDIGLDYREWIRAGYMLPVADLHLRYFRPLKMGDRFKVSITKFEILGRRSIKLTYIIKSLSKLKICEASIKVICVRTENNQVAIIPQQWQDILEKGKLKN
jgi:acyl-CoA thioester hydrolase